MAYTVRRRTGGFAQELFNDLLSNLGNLEHYANYDEYLRDLKLGNELEIWLTAENEHDTEVAE